MQRMAVFCRLLILRDAFLGCICHWRQQYRVPYTKPVSPPHLFHKLPSTTKEGERCEMCKARYKLLCYVVIMNLIILNKQNPSKENIPTDSAHAPACHLGQCCVLHMRVRRAFSLTMQFESTVTVLFDWSTHFAVLNCFPPPQVTSHLKKG